MVFEQLSLYMYLCQILYTTKWDTTQKFFSSWVSLCTESRCGFEVVVKTLSSLRFHYSGSTLPYLRRTWWLSAAISHWQSWMVSDQPVECLSYNTKNKQSLSYIYNIVRAVQQCWYNPIENIITRWCELSSVSSLLATIFLLSDRSKWVFPSRWTFG